MFRFIDLFAGIGGFRLALEAVGGVCVASSEIDTQARQVYRSNWPNDPAQHNLGDITKVFHLPAHELIVGGVPCQPWSIAGKNQAFGDPRGELWNDVIRLVRHHRPHAFLFENVKGMVDPRHQDYLTYIIESFKYAGYRVQYKLLNSFDYGVPQNRDRVFVVGIRSDLDALPFSFPPYRESTQRLYELFDGIEPPTEVQEIAIQRDLFGERVGMGFNKLTPKGQQNEFFVLNDIRHGPTSIHSWELWETTEREKAICMIMLRNRRNPRYGPCDGNSMSYEDVRDLLPDLQLAELETLQEKRILQRYDDERFEFTNRRLSGGIDGVYRIFLPDARFFGTLTARGMKDVVAEVAVRGETPEQYKQNFVSQVLRPRRFRAITAREAARLQGFPEHFTLHHSEKVNVQLFGNSVAVPVVEAVGQALIETGALVGQLPIEIAV